MPKRDLERELDELASGLDPAVLRKALRDRVNLVVAKAAARIASLGLKDAVPDLLAAFDRQFGEKADPQCWAKLAIAKALRDLNWSESAVFVRGAEYRQWEPVWGSEADSAGTLRAVCLLAIPSCTDLLRDQKFWILMRGLSDRLAPVRAEAARAIESMEGFEAALLLRLKARTPEQDASVTGQVFESLLNVEREPAIPFLLDSVEQRGLPERDEERAEQAILALGASRLPGTTDALIACTSNPRLRGLYEPVLRALSISRLPPALDFLIGIIENGRESDARIALGALEMHRASSDLAARVREAVLRRGSRTLQDVYERYFPAQP